MVVLRARMVQRRQHPYRRHLPLRSSYRSIEERFEPGRVRSEGTAENFVLSGAR
jgi:hypothetical protein